MFFRVWLLFYSYPSLESFSDNVKTKKLLIGLIAHRPFFQISSHLVQLHEKTTKTTTTTTPSTIIKTTINHFVLTGPIQSTIDQENLTIPEVNVADDSDTSSDVSIEKFTTPKQPSPTSVFETPLENKFLSKAAAAAADNKKRKKLPDKLLDFNYSDLSKYQKEVVNNQRKKKW
jgi:hypothetical protein